jgi:hypothetical protein
MGKVKQKRHASKVKYRPYHVIGQRQPIG